MKLLLMFKIENECPGTPTCSGKGECENGLCQCTSGFYGPDCSLLGSLSKKLLLLLLLIFYLFS